MGAAPGTLAHSVAGFPRDWTLDDAADRRFELNSVGSYPKWRAAQARAYELEHVAGVAGDNWTTPDGERTWLPCSAEPGVSDMESGDARPIW